MTNFTSSLPDNLLHQLHEVSQKLKIPKNKIIERALNKYLIEVDKQFYIKSFKKISGDEEFLKIAEEGIDDYHILLEKWDEER